jgi:hypothetical protein
LRILQEKRRRADALSRLHEINSESKEKDIPEDWSVGGTLPAEIGVVKRRPVELEH